MFLGPHSEIVTEFGKVAEFYIFVEVIDDPLRFLWVFVEI